MPFCTGTTLEVVNDALFTAFGWLPPPLMHDAVPESTATICASSPRPASFALTVMVLPEVVKVGVPTKCALPASAAVAEPRPMAPSIPTVAARPRSLLRMLRMLFLPCESLPTLPVPPIADVPERGTVTISLAERNILMAPSPFRELLQARAGWHSGVISLNHACVPRGASLTFPLPRHAGKGAGEDWAFRFLSANVAWRSACSSGQSSRRG